MTLVGQYQWPPVVAFAKCYMYIDMKCVSLSPFLSPPLSPSSLLPFITLPPFHPLPYLPSTLSSLPPTLPPSLPPSLSPSPPFLLGVCPCKNGGVCRPKSSGQGLECYCPKNFTGDLCQHLIEDGQSLN